MNLSRRGVTLGSLVLLMALAAQWLPGGDGGLWRTLAACWLLALAIEGLWTRGLRPGLQWQLPQPLRLGREASLRLRLANPLRRALHIDLYWPAPEGSDGDAQPQCLRIPAGAHVEPALDLVPLRLGALALAPVEARLLGRFGLAWWSRKLQPTPGSLNVEPDLLAASGTASGASPDGPSPRRFRGTGTELLGLRDYRPGDRLPSIDWKASARRNQLLVRDLAQEQTLDLVIVIDAGRAGCQRIGRLTRLHHAVNAAARLAERASALGDRIGLVVYDGAGVVVLPPRGGLSGLRALRRRLADLRASSGDADPLPAALAVRRQCRQRSLVLWFTDVDSGANPGPLREAARLLVPRHLPLFAGLADRELQALIEPSPQPSSWKAPYVALAAAYAMEGAERQARTLRHLGCEVVQAVPEDIDARLLARYRELRSRRRV